MGSTRLPGKVLLPLCSKPMLLHIVQRTRACGSFDDVIVATTTLPRDNTIAEFCSQYNISCFRGSEEDVLDRYYQAANVFKADVIMRLTADNALIDPSILAQALNDFSCHEQDYLYYADGLPLGTAVEVFTFTALKKAWQQSSDSECREHVTLYMYRNPSLFVCRRPALDCMNHHNLRLTTDTNQDFELTKRLYDNLYETNPYFGLDTVFACLKDHPDWFDLNKDIHQKTTTYTGR